MNLKGVENITHGAFRLAIHSDHSGNRYEKKQCDGFRSVPYVRFWLQADINL